MAPREGRVTLSREQRGLSVRVRLGLGRCTFSLEQKGQQAHTVFTHLLTYLLTRSLTHLFTFSLEQKGQQAHRVDDVRVEVEAERKLAIPLDQVNLGEEIDLRARAAAAMSAQ